MKSFDWIQISLINKWKVIMCSIFNFIFFYMILLWDIGKLCSTTKTVFTNIVLKILYILTKVKYFKVFIPFDPCMGGNDKNKMSMYAFLVKFYLFPSDGILQNFSQQFT